MSDLLPLMGYVMGAWVFGFSFGYVLKLYRRFMEQI
jgi:hypothetical protein